MKLTEELKGQFCSLEKLRGEFESYIKSSARWKDNTPLGTMTINGVFDHYMDADTDTMWISFALGYRSAILEHLEELTKPLTPAEKLKGAKLAELHGA